MNKGGKSYRWSKTVKGSINYSTVISAQSDAERTCWCCFTQQWPVTLWRSTFRWEFSIWIGRAVAIPAGTQIKCLLQASVLCYSLLSLTKHSHREAHQSTSALWSSMEIAVLNLFQICGLKVPGKYKLLYSKAEEVFHSTKCNICFWVMKTRHKIEWAALIFWD